MRVAPPPSTRQDDVASARRSVRRVGILSTYPPTACGLATFSAALARGLAADGREVHIVRVVDGGVGGGVDGHVEGAPSGTGGVVVGDLLPGSPSSAVAAATLLDGCDVAVIQHEYGVFGGEDGEEVLTVLAHLRVPSIVVAHTVLRDPTPHQRSVLIEAAALADQVVVMSRAARDRLCEGFDVDPAKVTIIPHGAVVHVPSERGAVDPTSILTWGLVGPGKGLERVIDVLPALRRRNPATTYTIAGRTHPKVLTSQGESYREARGAQARRLDVADAVTFDPAYRDVQALSALVQSCGVVVLPYDATDQVTSGVLVDAVAAGRPVVATAFPHAVELLSSGAGIVVPHDDPDALELALARVINRPQIAARMAAAAARLAPEMGWPVVARRYLALAAHLSAARSASV